MSREIKYKIWSKETKRFVQSDTDIANRKGYELGEYALSADGKVYFFEATEGGMDTRLVENVVIIFYTGLKDKNGVEIYEGDIIKRKVFENKSYVEKYFKVFIEDGITRNLPVYLIQGDHIDEYFRCVSKDVEVVGNIYENLELIK